MIIFVIFVWLSSIMEGAGGLNATVLDGSIDENVTIIPVDTTEGFLTAGVIVIGNEQIYYAGVTPTSLQEL